MAVTDYYLLDYIESSGSQYINTNYYPTSTTVILTKTRCTSTSTKDAWTQLAGERSSYHASDSVQIAFNTSTNLWGIDIGTNNGGSYNGQKNIDYIIELDIQNGCKINNTLLNKSGMWSGTASYPLWLFDDNDAGKHETYFTGRLYYFDIKENSTYKRKFRPVKRKSDNVLGMYDLVENKFYTNLGSGSFIAGSTLTGSISVSKNINEAGNISGGIGNKFPDGSIGTTLNATTNNGYHFLGWYNSSGQLVSTNTSYTYIGSEGASFVAKYAYLDNIVKPNKSLSPINFNFDNSMNGLQFRKWDSPRSPLILDMGANNAGGSYRQVFIIGGDSINIYSCCIFTQGDDAYAKKTSLDTTNTTYSATKVGNLLTINFSSTIWGPTWVLWN